MAKIFHPETLELSNGIPVILQHYEGPVAALYWWVRTGSADEDKGEEGFAHFLEHMLFKDAAAKETGKASTGKMARTIESLGGDINAYTSFDQTVYHVTCAAQHWEKVLDAWGTMAKPQKFLKSDFTREREVILEELAKNEDSPSRQLFQSTFSSTFHKHPYGRPVIGYVKTLKAATVGQLEAFYQRCYIPEKMGLVVVGPLGDAKSARARTILKLLEKRFGKGVLPRSKKTAPDFNRPIEAPTRKEVETVARGFDVTTPSLNVSFRVPDLKHADIPALDLLGSILGMGELSRLYQKLFYQNSSVTDVSGGLYVPRDPGMMYFHAETESVAKVAPACEQIFRELVRIRDEGPTRDELARVMVNAESERLYSTQTADGIAGRLGFLRFVLGDLEYDQKYLGALRLVDAAKIKEVAKEYLNASRLSCVVLLPKAEVKAYPKDELSKLGESILGMGEVPEEAVLKRGVKGAASEIEPIEFMKMPSGLQIVHYYRPQSHVFSAHASMLGGTRSELTQPVSSAEKDWGSSYMMSLTWAKGTAEKDSREIARIVEGSAAGMEGYNGRNTVGLHLTGLARDWSKLSALFAEVLVTPSFPDDEVEHSRRVAEDSVRGLEDHSSQLCSMQFLETLYETHPYGKLTTGSLASLAGIDSKRLRDFHARWLDPKNLVVSVSGPIKRAEISAWAIELDRELSKHQTTGIHPGQLHLVDEPALVAPRWIEKEFGREQVHILVGGLGVRIASDDRYAIRLMQNILGGQGGRLFVELREKKSLAYTVSPTSFEGLERGYIGTYIACSPEKRKEAIDGIRRELEKLAAKGPTAVEMNRAKEYYLGHRAMDMQSDSALAPHYGIEALYGIRHKTEAEIARIVRKVTAKEVQAACRKYLVEPHMVTSTVG